MDVYTWSYVGFVVVSSRSLKINGIRACGMFPFNNFFLFITPLVSIVILAPGNLRSRVSLCCVNSHFNGSFIYGCLRRGDEDDIQRMIQSINRLWGLV